jgi:hypothetical protein
MASQPPGTPMPAGGNAFLPAKSSEEKETQMPDGRGAC